MITGYKWTRPDGMAWYDAAFGPYRVGATLTVPDAQPGEPCGVGLHIGKTVEGCFQGGSFPGALWRVEADGPVLGQDAEKLRVGSLRVVAAIEKPAWIVAVEAFLATIPRLPWFQPTGPPDPTWQHHAAGAAAWDAALMACLALVADLDYPHKAQHEAHARARWDVWQRGYGLACDVSGVLYTYGRP